MFWQTNITLSKSAILRLTALLQLTKTETKIKTWNNTDVNQTKNKI